MDQIRKSMMVLKLNQDVAESLRGVLNCVSYICEAVVENDVKKLHQNIAGLVAGCSEKEFEILWSAYMQSFHKAGFCEDKDCEYKLEEETAKN